MTNEQLQRLEHIMRSLQTDICRLHDKLDAGEGKADHAEPEASGPSPMPEPVDVWVYKYGDNPWVACEREPVNPAGDSLGPYQIIPGMMSLDELTKCGVFVCNERGRWYVRNRQGTVCAASMTDATALQTQWEATCIAREGGKP